MEGTMGEKKKFYLIFLGDEIGVLRRPGYSDLSCIQLHTLRKV